LFVQPSPFLIRGAVATFAFVALALSGCGRIGPLEPPPDASTQATQAKPSMPKPNDVNAETLNPQMKPKIPPITPPNRPFFLDFLLK
jgi:predicted small lipoprotein YifL